MKNLNFIKHKNFTLYFFEEKYKDLLKSIIDKKYEVLKEYKNDDRTYVAKIKIGENIFLLKKPFLKRKLKKLLSFFKKGESLETFLNINYLKNNGVKELGDIYGACVLKKGIISEEFFIGEFCEGKIYLEEDKYKKIIEVTKKLHFLGFFHGDCNPYNFLFNKDGEIKILDTKCKKMIFGNYRAHYDILTIKTYFKKEIDYPYKKNLFYFLAALIKKKRKKI